MSLVIIQYKFTAEEAGILKAKNPSATLCDRNSFSFINFEGREVKAGNKSDLTTYMVKKAVELGAKK